MKKLILALGAITVVTLSIGCKQQSINNINEKEVNPSIQIEESNKTITKSDKTTKQLCKIPNNELIPPEFTIIKEAYPKFVYIGNDNISNIETFFKELPTFKKKKEYTASNRRIIKINDKDYDIVISQEQSSKKVKIAYNCILENIPRRKETIKTTDNQVQSFEIEVEAQVNTN